MAETQSFDLRELFSSLPKCVYTIGKYEGTGSADDELQNFRSEEFSLADDEKKLTESILQDDSSKLISQLKSLIQSASDHEHLDSPDVLDCGVVSKLLRLCCTFDSVNCASALINGEIGAVPHLNEMDDSGWSVLHTAAEMHARKCVELLLRKRARTDLKSKDRRPQLPLELALASRRMDVVWNPNDSIEDLLVCLSQKDLSVITLLAKKTKEITEVAYACAIECHVVALAALLMVVPEKVNAPILLVRTDADLGLKDKTTIYECIIREALSLGCLGTLSPKVTNRIASWTDSEKAERRKLLLCEMEILQLFGAAAQQSNSMDKKFRSPLIRASQARDEAVIELLLKTNIDINDADTEGNTALHWSLKMYKDASPQLIRILWLLLNHGAQVRQKNRLGLTALHIAAAKGNIQALQILLSEDPNIVDSTTEMLETPLFFAAKSDFVDCAKLLLRFGANSEVLNLRLNTINGLSCSFCRQRPIDMAKSQDMRFVLTATNISFTSQSFQKKYTSCLQNDQVFPKSWQGILTRTKECATAENNFFSPKAEICTNVDSPCESAKSFPTQSKEDLWWTKQDTYPTLFLSAEELKHKIFVGGLPPSLDSASLAKFFEEQFGPVEDAIVVNSQAGQLIQSRGFGFVTFKDEQSVSAAIQVHYVNIEGKQVEIKTAVPNCQLLVNFQKLSSQQQLEQQNNKLQSPVPGPKGNTDRGNPEKMALVNRLPCFQQKAYSSEPQVAVCTTSPDQCMPAWVSIFKKWLPNFLLEVSKRLRGGEWYPLSSLKADFRAACGLELDHSSLGYPKLSDFMRSLPGLCRMKVVPIGRRGPATHMVLLPSLVMPNHQVIELVRMMELPHDTRFNDSTDNDYDDINFLEEFPLLGDFPLLSYANFDFIEEGSEKTNLSYRTFSCEASEAFQAQNDDLHCVQPRFLEFLNPDPLFHARPWLTEKNCGDAEDNDYSERSSRKPREGGEGNEEDKLQQLPRHVVLEALARMRKSTSVFFLREFDFYDNYKASVERGKCFACNQGKMLWTNYPCQHSLWCSDCKLLATRAAGTFEHKCVVCNAEVEEIIWKPWNENPRQTCNNIPSEEFPPFDPDDLRM